MTPDERRMFMAVCLTAEDDAKTFGLTLAYTGARISEVLELSPSSFDFGLHAVIIRTLKRRRPDVYRAVPVPNEFMDSLDAIFDLRSKQTEPLERNRPIWSFCRTTGWSLIKSLMEQAGIRGGGAMPKGLRHGLGVMGTAEANVPLNVMQRWLGHARIETTAIYANAVGKEERALAARLW